MSTQQIAFDFSAALADTTPRVVTVIAPPNHPYRGAALPPKADVPQAAEWVVSIHTGGDTGETRREETKLSMMEAWRRCQALNEQPGVIAWMTLVGKYQKRIAG